MKQRWLLNLVLLLVVLGLGSVALWTWKTDVPEPILPLTALDKTQIQRIIVTRESEPSIILEKQQQHWYITEPLQLAANTFRVDSILQILKTKHYQALDSNTDLMPLGLDTPTVQLHIDETTLGLGIKSPFNDGRRYMLVNQKPYLITDTISHFLAGDAALFASLSPLGDDPQITRLVLPDLTLQRQGHIWELQTAADDTVDTSADALHGLVKAWQQLQALSVRPYEPKQGDFGQVSISLVTQSQSMIFKVMATEPEFILALPTKQVQYQIASEQVDSLFALPTKQMDKEDE